MSLFSIIVVSLNTKEKFKKTIQSILNQSIKNYEIIVIDGKSNDGTKEIISKYNKDIKKKLIQKDKGIYYGMNRGIKLASNKWLIFLNSGDIFYSSNTLKKLSYHLKKNREADVIIGNSKIKKKKFFYKKKYTKINKKSLISCFSHQSCAIKTSLHKKNLFKTKYKITADFNFFKDLLKKNVKFNYINDIISISEADGLSDKKRFLALAEFYQINKSNQFINFKFFRYSMIYIYFLFIYVVKLTIPSNFHKKLIQIKHSINLTN